TSSGSSRSVMTGTDPRRGHAGRGSGVRRLIRHVEEERGRPALAREHALALLGGLARLFAVLAANRERQRTQPRLGDFVAALEAVAVGPFLQTTERLVDLVERLRLHLDERELDVFLDVDLGALALVEHVVLLVAHRPAVCA